MDIALALLEVLRRVAFYHIIPASILSFTTLLLVLGIIKLFKIKRPAVRGALFLLLS